VVLEHVIAHQVDLILPLAYAPLVPPWLEIVAPFWAMSIAPTHLIPSLVLERYVV